MNWVSRRDTNSDSCLLINRSNIICPCNRCSSWYCGKKQWSIPCSCHYCWWTGFTYLCYFISIFSWHNLFFTNFLFYFWNIFFLQVTRNSGTPHGKFSPQEQATINSIVAAR